MRCKFWYILRRMANGSLLSLWFVFLTERFTSNLSFSLLDTNGLFRAGRPFSRLSKSSATCRMTSSSASLYGSSSYMSTRARRNVCERSLVRWSLVGPWGELHASQPDIGQSPAAKKDRTLLRTAAARIVHEGRVAIARSWSPTQARGAQRDARD